MGNHEIGILTFLLLGLALMFLPNAIRVRHKDTQCETAANPKPWQVWLSVLAFLQAIAFVAIAIACEAVGTHWAIGLLCVCGSLLCSATILGLFGLRPRHFLS